MFHVKLIYKQKIINKYNMYLNIIIVNISAIKRNYRSSWNIKNKENI